MNDIIPLQSVANDVMANLLNQRESNSSEIDFKIGDTITFKAQTMYSCRKATRKVVGKDYTGRPLVRYDGWDDFQIRWNEITHINGVRV
tara:strand:- start:3862 stop:4128 length:267 start_codon:yes stop_codon:yes gene_type:complete